VVVRGDLMFAPSIEHSLLFCCELFFCSAEPVYWVILLQFRRPNSVSQQDHLLSLVCFDPVATLAILVEVLMGGNENFTREIRNSKVMTKKYEIHPFNRFRRGVRLERFSALM
jgi:hypothetical protein